MCLPNGIQFQIPVKNERKLKVRLIRKEREKLLNLRKSSQIIANPSEQKDDIAALEQEEAEEKKSKS